MTLPVSGSLSFNQIRSELGLGGALSLNDTAVRALAGKPSGIISVSDLFGKSALPHLSNPFYVGQDNFQNDFTSGWGYAIISTSGGGINAVMSVPARPYGMPSDMTAYVYQGNGASYMNIDFFSDTNNPVGDFTSILNSAFSKVIIGNYVLTRTSNWMFDSKYGVNYTTFQPVIPLSDAQLLALGTVNVEFGN